MRLLLSPALKSSQRPILVGIAAGLPFHYGSPVLVIAQPELSAHRGRLLSRAGQGTPVYAASFIRQRRIVLERSLFEDEPLLRLVFTHELFHFVWPRLGNRARRGYSDLLEGERLGRARGELGDSSDIRKRMACSDARHWRDYVCESFCDTGAHLYGGVPKHHWFQLAARWITRRSAWFDLCFGRPPFRAIN